MSAERLAKPALEDRGQKMGVFSGECRAPARRLAPRNEVHVSNAGKARVSHKNTFDCPDT